MAAHDEVGSADTVQAARTTFDIVEYVRGADGTTVTEVARELGYAKSTAHRHLSTLRELGYIVEEPDGYHVSLRFLDLGQQARNRHDSFNLAKDKVEEIAQQTGERAQFLAEEHSEAVYVHRSFGDKAVRTDSGIGSRIPLHATAGGKAILANMTDDRRYGIIEQSDFDSITDSTITDRDRLYDELEVIRNRGYSFNREENLEGLHAVGVPVTDSDDTVIGALSVSGPTHRLKGERIKSELPNLLLGSANELELNIAHS